MENRIDTLKIFADDQRTIAYRPEWKDMTGSVTSAILLQQILYRWDQNGRKAFYKFKEKCSHELYRPGDSWTEELGFTRAEFDSALKRIASKKTETDSREAVKPVEYWTDVNRITHYNVNPEVLEASLNQLYVKQESSFRKSGNPALEYVKRESSFRKSENPALEYNRDNVQRKTTYRDGVNCHPDQAPEQKAASQEKDVLPSSSFSFDLALVPEQFRKSSALLTRIMRALKKYNREYVEQSFMYACDNSTAQNAQAFGAFFGRALEEGWAEGYDSAEERRKKQARIDRIRLEEQESDRRLREEQARLKTMHEALELLQQKNPEKYRSLEKQAAEALGLNLRRLNSVIGGRLKIKHKMFELMGVQKVAS